MIQALQRLNYLGVIVLLLVHSVPATADSERASVKFPYTLNEADLTQIIAVASEQGMSIGAPIDSLETWKHNEPRSYGATFVFSPFETTDRSARHIQLDCERDEAADWVCQRQEITQLSVGVDQSPDVLVAGDENTNLSEAVEVIDLVYGTVRRFSHPVKIIEVDAGFDVGYFGGRCTEYLPVRWSEGAGEFQVPEVHRVRKECPKRKVRAGK